MSSTTFAELFAQNEAYLAEQGGLPDPGELDPIVARWQLQYGHDEDDADDLPDGEYDFVVQKALSQRNTEGQEMFSTHVFVTSGPYMRKQLFHTFVLEPDNPPALAIFFSQFVATGLVKAFWMANPYLTQVAEALENRWFRGTVKTWRGRSVITEFRPGIRPTPSPPAPPPPQPGEPTSAARTRRLAVSAMQKLLRSRTHDDIVDFGDISDEELIALGELGSISLDLRKARAELLLHDLEAQWRQS
jgi:hypothetical protein